VQGVAGAAAPVVVGRYALYGKIASGGMATVYFGRLVGAAGFTRTVAIKRLHPHLAEEPDFVSMMIDEARVVARVHHPNVAQTLDVVTEGGELLIVMEYIAGESLARLLRAEGARQRHVPLNVVGSVMSGVLNGLHAAHEARSDRGQPLEIVHRDVSPHNVIVGVDGLARVIDFGVAKAAGRLQTTRQGVIKGKVPYMAPEQFAGQPTTRLADVYAAGVVLWEMLTGRRLFKAEDEPTLIAQVVAGNSEPPSRWVPDLPAEIDAVVMRALSRDPAARFATAREMADALTRAAPPALANETGAWVEDAAKEVLAARGAQLAEIESQTSAVARIHPEPVSSQGLRAPQVPPTSPAPVTVVDDLPTIASQPSSISVETPSGGMARALRARRSRVTLLAGGAIVVGGIMAVVAWRAASSPATEAGGPPPGETASAAEPPPSPSPPATSAAAVGPAATAAPTPSASTVATVPPHAPPAARPGRSTPGSPPSRPAAQAPARRQTTPAGSVVFTTAD
jgi:serine/threonine-protein kinase